MNEGVIVVIGILVIVGLAAVVACSTDESSRSRD